MAHDKYVDLNLDWSEPTNNKSIPLFIDSDAITKRFSLRQCQIIIWISSIISLILGVWAFIILEQYYFFPFVFLPIGTMYTFRRPTKSTQGVKDIGILIGNFLLIYFICLITLQMASII